MGVVIGETAEIGDDVLMYHGVTLGGRTRDVGKRHPTLQDGVAVGAGAKILGPVTVGARSVVGANAVVTKDAPADSVLHLAVVVSEVHPGEGDEQQDCGHERALQMHRLPGDRGPGHLDRIDAEVRRALGEHGEDPEVEGVVQHEERERDGQHARDRGEERAECGRQH
ncbi:unnamed protein product, partial [Penicillium discolor]